MQISLKDLNFNLVISLDRAQTLDQFSSRHRHRLDRMNDIIFEQAQANRHYLKQSLRSRGHR